MPDTSILGLLLQIGVHRVNAWSTFSNSWQHAGHSLPILTKCFPEARLQFTIFHADHPRPGDPGEPRQCIQHDQSRSEAPANNLAEMTQIDRMAHARANTSCDQLLAMAVGLQFGQARNLHPVESLERRAVNRES